MPKLPSVSGKKTIKSLNKMGFVIVRQRGSHVFMQKAHSARLPSHVTVAMADRAAVSSVLKSAGCGRRGDIIFPCPSRNI